VSGTYRLSPGCCGSRAAAVLSTLGVVVGLVLAVLWSTAAGGRAAAANAGLSFVSLFPVFQPSEIDVYSLPSGNRIGKLAPVPLLPSTARNSGVSAPHLLADGHYMITAYHGELCASRQGKCAPVANTCASEVETLDPATKVYRALFAVDGAWKVYDAVPNPDGRSVALLEGACNGSPVQIVVRNLGNGAQHVVAARLGECALGSSAAWTRDGTRLVFAYASHQNPNDPSGNCGLAFAPAVRTTSPSSWPVIHPDKSCSFQSFAYDAVGLGAIENCPNTAATNLLQYGSTARVLRRWTLDPNGQPTAMVYDAQTRTVLVSEIVSDQPDYTNIWTLDGSRLHLVQLYFGADILADP